MFQSPDVNALSKAHQKAYAHRLKIVHGCEGLPAQACFVHLLDAKGDPLEPAVLIRKHVRGRYLPGFIDQAVKLFALEPRDVEGGAL